MCACTMWARNKNTGKMTLSLTGNQPTETGSIGWLVSPYDFVRRYKHRKGNTLATNKVERMSADKVVSEFSRIERETFFKASVLVLDGWCRTYELWQETGMSKNAFAGLLVENGFFDAPATINTNLGHIEWALDDNGFEDCDEIRNEFSSITEIRNARKGKPTERAIKATKSVKFDAVKQAEKFTVKQLEAMLAAKRAK